MAEKEKLPITVTFEIIQHPEPNERWFDVTAVLSNEGAGFSQRMDTCLVLQNELGEIKEALCFRIGQTFTIQEMNDVVGSTTAYELWKACTSALAAGKTLTLHGQKLTKVELEALKSSLWVTHEDRTKIMVEARLPEWKSLELQVRVV
jgi:hypothetical protein